MALDFPNPPQADGAPWIDDCDNEWIYHAASNSWAINPPAIVLPDVDPDVIWARQGTTIAPINAGDVLNMGTQNAEIDFNSFLKKPNGTQ